MALVAQRALDRIGASAHAREAGVGLGAGVAVVARGAVGLRRLRAIGAETRLGGAHAGFVTLVLGAAEDRLGTGAHARRAGVGSGAGVAVVARGAVGPGWGRARARGAVADGVVTRILSDARDPLRADADAELAGVEPSAGVPVVAGSSVLHRLQAAFLRGRVAHRLVTRQPKRGHRVADLGADVDAAAVGADGDRLRILHPERPTDAVPMGLDEGELAGGAIAVEDRERVVELAGGVDVGAVRCDHHRLSAVEAVDAAYAVPLHLDEGQVAGGRIAAEDRERIGLAAHHVHVCAVGADGHAARLVEAVDAPDAVTEHAQELERAGLGVAAEDHHRVAERGGHVDVGTVGADRHRERPFETVDAADAVALRLDERDGSRRRVATEDCHGVVLVAGDVEMCAVGAQDDLLGTTQAGDAAHPVVLHFDQCERTALGVAPEDGERPVDACDDVDVRAVGTYRHRLGTAQPIDAARSRALHLDEGQGAGEEVAAEDGDGIVIGAGDVEGRAVGADRQTLGAVEAADAALLRAGEGEDARARRRGSREEQPHGQAESDGQPNPRHTSGLR